MNPFFSCEHDSPIKKLLCSNEEIANKISSWDSFPIKNSFTSFADVSTYCIVDHIPDLKPLVSILIPTFRRPELLRESISSALNQVTDLIYEVVVVDNEAYDPVFHRKVEGVVNAFGRVNMRYFRNEKNIGMFANWNRCIELARGNWITILNDDDLLSPDFLSKVSYSINGNPQKAGVAVNYQIITGSCKHTTGNILLKGFKILDEIFFWGRRRHLNLTGFLLRPPIHGTLGVLLRKDVYLEIGGFNPDYYPIADLLLWAHLLKTNRIGWIHEVLCSYRLEVNESLKPKMKEAFLIGEYLVRKRFISSGPAMSKFANVCNDLFTSSIISLSFNNNPSASAINHNDLFFRGYAGLKSRLFALGYIVFCGLR